MKYALCGTLFFISLCVYPFLIRISNDLTPLWGPTEWDLFNWLRMLVVAAAGIPALIFLRKKDWPIMAYLLLLLLSTVTSRYPEAAIMGTPSFYEGCLALLGYVGIYLLARECGNSKLLHLTFLSVVYVVVIVAGLQAIYGNFLNFPLFKLIMPKLSFACIKWPLYSTLGSPNHLGLFCALFFPYMLIKKEWVVVYCLLCLLVGCQTRGAWVSVIITTLIISRKNFTWIIIACVFISIPIYKNIAERVRNTTHALHYPFKDQDLSGRGFIWARSRPIIKNTILLGNGPATYPLYFPQYSKRGNAMGYQGLIVDRPHNIYLNIWVSTGLVSLLILMASILRKIKSSNDKALKMAAIGFLLAGFFTDSVICVTPYFVTILGIMGEE